MGAVEGGTCGTAVVVDGGGMFGRAMVVEGGTCGTAVGADGGGM